MMSRNVQVKTKPAYLLTSFYTALDGYIESFDTQPKHMVGTPDGWLSGEEWLAQARNFANQLPEQSDQLLRVIVEVQQLVDKGRYEVARRIVRSGTRATESEIRALGRG